MFKIKIKQESFIFVKKSFGHVTLHSFSHILTQHSLASTTNVNV